MREYAVPFALGFGIVYVVSALVGCVGEPIVPVTDGATNDAGFVEDAGPTDAPSTDAPPTDVPSADDAGTPTDDAPLTDAPVDVHTREGFAREAARQLCEAWAACAGCTEPSATCVEDYTARTLEEESTTTFHADLVDGYLALLEDAYGACQQVSWAELAGFPFHNGREIGETCASAADCISHSCQSDGGVATCREVEPSARGALCL